MAVAKSRSLSSVLRSASFWSKWTGVRLPLALALAMIWLASRWLRQEYGQEDTNLWLVMNAFLILVQWTIIGLFAFSLLSALSVWLYFKFVVAKKADLRVQFGDGQQAEAGWVTVAVSLSGSALRPLLGSIQARLVFSDARVSEPIILDANQRHRRQLWRERIVGRGETLLHDRGIYDLQKVLISFCDMFGLVALPASLVYTQQLYTLPPAEEPAHLRTSPQSTEEQKYRIDVPKKVEGEYVNYKEFESGDNIQRIVWKIYAKSGELVVRIPEIKDPYASHLYFYISFFHGLEMASGAFETELLNVYKDRLRTLLEALQRNDFSVRIPHDQEVPKLAGVGDRKTELYQIAASSWQDQFHATAFVNYSKAALVGLSSLTPAEEVATIVKNLPAHVPLVIVKLSTAIPSPFSFSFRHIFFAPPKGPADHLRQPWLVSGLRKKLIKNEEQLSELIRQRPNSWLTERIELEA